MAHPIVKRSRHADRASSRRWCAVCVLVALLLFSSKGGWAAGESDLPTARATEVIDPRPLIKMSQWIRGQNLDVRSLLIVKDDKLIFERYSNGLDRDHNYFVYSVTKTVTGMLFGILADQGRIHPTDKVAAWIETLRPDLSDLLTDKRGIEFRHLLSMTSGLYYPIKPGAAPPWFAAPDRLQLALTSTPAAPPGTSFHYTEVNPLLVGAAINAAAGMPLQRFADSVLFTPLHMKNHVWTTADATGSVPGGWGLRLRPVDMAKLGMLMLHDGRWQDRQVVSERWVRQMTTPSATADDYGYFLWINNIVTAEPEFGAVGFKGQFITVLPNEKAVVVMTSLLKVDGGLRDAVYINHYRQMVKTFVLPALHGSLAPSQVGDVEQALQVELRLSLDGKGEPAPPLSPFDAVIDRPETCCGG